MPAKKPKRQKDRKTVSTAIVPEPMCIQLKLDGEDVLLLSSVSVAQWKAELGPETFEDRFTDVMDTVGPRLDPSEPMNNQN